MGACLSSSNAHLSGVDDSVHVMLAHDRKKRKESGNATSTGYKARAPNPALERAKQEAQVEKGEEKTEETTNGD